MAQFKNVSGIAREVRIPDWPGQKVVEAGEVLTVADDVACKYEWGQVGVWEPVEQAPPKSATSKGSV